MPGTVEAGPARQLPRLPAGPAGLHLLQVIRATQLGDGPYLIHGLQRCTHLACPVAPDCTCCRWAYGLCSIYRLPPMVIAPITPPVSLVPPDYTCCRCSARSSLLLPHSRFPSPSLRLPSTPPPIPLIPADAWVGTPRCRPAIPQGKTGFLAETLPFFSETLRLSAPQQGEHSGVPGRRAGRSEAS